MHDTYFCIVLKFNLLSKVLFITVKEISEENLAKVFQADNNLFFSSVSHTTYFIITHIIPIHLHTFLMSNICDASVHYRFVGSLRTGTILVMYASWYFMKHTLDCFAHAGLSIFNDLIRVIHGKIQQWG